MKVRLKYSAQVIENVIRKFVGDDYKIMDDGEIAINSPFMSDTTYDCRISVGKQCFHDFESDEGGNIEKLVAQIAGIEVEQAKELLIANSNGEVETHTKEKKQPEIIETKIMESVPGAFTFDRDERRGSLFNSNLAKRFLASKMVDYKLAKKYNLTWTESSFVSAEDKKINLSNRIIIPTYENGRLVYFQARDYTGKSSLRYKNPPKALQPKSIILPFYDNIVEKEILFISEGPWEAIQYSGTYMLGPGLTDRQILKIKTKNPKSIYLIPDNDETGRRKLAKNISAIKSYLTCPIYIVKWWIGDYADFKDPIDASIGFDDLINSEFLVASRHTDLRVLAGAL